MDRDGFWQCSIQRCRSDGGRGRERGFNGVEQMKEVGFLEASEKGQVYIVIK